MAVVFRAARELVDGDLIEMRELPFRTAREAIGYTAADGDERVRIGSPDGPHTDLGDGRILLHTSRGSYDVLADLDFVVLGAS
jgi:uncharacterized protein YjlB